MAIRPTDVRRKEFKSGFRGYDANEVDDFLDEVADEFERTFAENQRMTEEITSLKERLEQFEHLEGAIREALVQAQQVARDLRQNANKEAELILREAKEKSHRILADSSSRVERVQESYEVLRKAKQDFANDFRHLLKSYFSVMDNVDVTSAKEIEASLRERLDTESIVVAREAAETRSTGRDDDAATQGSAPRENTGAESADETQRIHPVASRPTGTTDGATTANAGTTGGAAANGPATNGPATGEASAGSATAGGDEPRPEAEEPEVEPSSAEDTARFSVPSSSGATGEVDREEPMPPSGEEQRQGRAADEFFEQGGGRNEDEERKIFRASRFLRRRG